MTKLRYLIKSAIPDSLLRFRRRRNDLKALSVWKKDGRPYPTPHIVKQLAIENLQRSTGSNTLVETGTFAGDMIEAQRHNFRKIYSIELSEDLHRMAAHRFRNFDHIEIIQGDSATMLAEIVAKLDAPTIFWLDGHYSGAYEGGTNELGEYSGGMTAKGEKECPVIEELEAIFNSGIDHHLLVDDARCFGNDKDYPSIEEVKAIVNRFRPGYSVSVQDDIIHIYRQP